MKFFASLILALAIFGSKVQAQQPPVITLQKRNTLVLRTVIDEMSVSDLQDKALKMSQELAPNENIYLVLDTPGGSVEAGAKLITTLSALPQKVHTITVFSASMGFVTAQSLGVRYIVPNGILMAHRASGGAHGQIPGELNTRVNFFTEMLDRQDAKISARVGMSKEAFQKLIDHEYWVDGQQAVSNKMADKTVLVRCDRDLSQGRVTETLQTFFGQVELKYSSCPIISAPLEINFGGLNLSEYNDNDRKLLVNIRKIIFSLVYNKQEFYHEYILTNQYKQLFL